MKKYSRWTKYEDEVLRRRCLEGITMAEALELFPGRTENALQNEARKLGVPSPKAYKKPKKAADRRLPPIQLSYARRLPAPVRGRCKRGIRGPDSRRRR